MKMNIGSWCALAVFLTVVTRLEAWADTPLFHTTLDDAASVMSPVRGSGAGASITTSPIDDFVAAREGNGLRCDAIGERVLVRQREGTTQNVELDRGTIEFWYRPFYDHNDDLKYTLWGTGLWQTPGSLHVGKHNNSNENALFLIFFDSVGQLVQGNVEVHNFAWSAGDWIRIRITWDFMVAPGVQNLHVYMNDIETILTATPNGPIPTGPYVMGEESESNYLYIGSRDTEGGIIPNGVHDEFKVFADVLPPGIFADGFESGGTSFWTTWRRRDSKSWPRCPDLVRCPGLPPSSLMLRTEASWHAPDIPARLAAGRGPEDP